MKTKQEIRRECRKARTEQSSADREEKSAGICRSILASESYRKARQVLAYMATQGEVDLAEVIEDAWRTGKKVAVPRVAGKEMHFYLIHSRDDLEEGSFHILEPKEYCEAADPTLPSLFLIPGVAYDREGRRIGYGGGFYDRYLAAWPQHETVGIAFSFQIYDCLPSESTDRRVSRVITEDGRLSENSFRQSGIPSCRKQFPDSLPGKRRAGIVDITQTMG